MVVFAFGLCGIILIQGFTFGLNLLACFPGLRCLQRDIVCLLGGTVVASEEVFVALKFTSFLKSLFASLLKSLFPSF